MSFYCSSLGSVKRLGAFEWYIYLLTDDLSDALRNDIKKNFDSLGKMLGEDAVIIQGKAYAVASGAISILSVAS